MPVTTAWYGPGLQYLLDTPLDLETATLKLALVTNAYTPNRDTHDFRDDFTANEVANGNGYTTGGATVGSPLWSLDTGTQQVRLDVADVSWTFTGSKTWRYGVLYVDTGGADSTDPLVALLTWDADQTVSTAYTLQIDPAGLLAIDYT